MEVKEFKKLVDEAKLEQTKYENEVVGAMWFEVLNRPTSPELREICSKRQRERMPKNATVIYLMKDLRSGFYKIGRSNNPSYREKTLQAEQPLIEFIVGWLAEPEVEKFLHDSLASKRIRGEWFALDDNDLRRLFYIFQNAEIYGEEDTLQNKIKLLRSEMESYDTAGWIECLEIDI